MKKTLAAILLALAGLAQAGVEIGENGTLKAGGAGYVYSRDSGVWLYVEANSAPDAWSGPTNNYYPAGAGDIWVTGYTYEKGIFTPNSGIVDSTFYNEESLKANHVYVGTSGELGWGDFRTTLTTLHLGKDVVLTFGDLGIKHNVTLDYGDLTGSAARLVSTKIWLGEANAITLSGAYTMTSSYLEYVLIDTTNGMDGVREDWLSNEMTVCDELGALANRGVISDIDELKVGEYALLHAGNRVSLVAKAIPEPATVSLSLLALAGLWVRRRR